MIFYRKPSDLFTKRDAFLRNSRVIGQKVAELHFLAEYPAHFRGSGTPLLPEVVFELRSALNAGRALSHHETVLLQSAERAGQVIRANLYRTLQSFDQKPPTLREAAKYLQAHFEDGGLRSWITEYHNRKTGKKAVWTVGDSIHADDRRYIEFDLWKSHFKWEPRDRYNAQGRRHSEKSDFTRWVAVDVDNHGTEPTTSLSEWIARYSTMHELLSSMQMQCLVQVNPKNGSYQIWLPVPKWGLERVADFADRVTAACPWVREIYPTKSKWAIICPLRPDKVNLIGPGEVPKARCRPQAWCYDQIAAWRWHRQPTQIDPDAVRSVLERSFLAKSAAAVMKVPVNAQKTTNKATGQVPKPKKTAATPRTNAPRRELAPLRGQWLDILAETYLDAVEPPDGSFVALMTPQLRLFRDGEADKARHFLRDVIGFMRDRHWEFSDRVQNDPDELLRTLDCICANRHHGTKIQELSKVDEARKRLDELGFDGSFDSILKALATRRETPRSSGAADLPLVTDELITTTVCALAARTKTDHHTALTFLTRLVNHVAQKHELSYSFLKAIASSMGLRLSTWKTQKVFQILLGKKIIKKIKNYSRCTEWSTGNQYAVTDKVRFVNGDDGTLGTTQDDTGYSSNNTISRFLTNDGDQSEMDEYASEVMRLGSDKRTAERIRFSLAKRASAQRTAPRSM